MDNKHQENTTLYLLLYNMFGKLYKLTQLTFFFTKLRNVNIAFTQQDLLYYTPLLRDIVVHHS